MVENLRSTAEMLWEDQKALWEFMYDSLSRAIESRRTPEDPLATIHELGPKLPTASQSNLETTYPTAA